MDGRIGGNEMTKAERNAIKARTNNLTEQGIDKSIAKAMAEAELLAGIIKPVVNGNH